LEAAMMERKDTNDNNNEKDDLYNKIYLLCQRIEALETKVARMLLYGGMAIMLLIGWKFV
jgi:hypothetical protein